MAAWLWDAKQVWALGLFLIRKRVDKAPSLSVSGQPQGEIEIIGYFAQPGVQKGLLEKAVPEVEPERMNLTSGEEGQDIQVEGKVQAKTQRFVRVACVGKKSESVMVVGDET